MLYSENLILHVGKIFFNYLFIWLHWVLVVADRLRQAQLPYDKQDLSFLTRDQTGITCIRRHIFNH